MGKYTLTNKFNLPETIVQACKVDTHRIAGDISTTQLIDAPRIRILKMQNDYSTDVSELLYAMMGTALHHIIERANIENETQRAFILTAETIIRKAEEIQDNDEAKAKQLKAAGQYVLNLIPVFFPNLKDRYIYEQTLRAEIDGMTLYGTFDLYDKETGILYDYKFCSVFNWMYPEARLKWQRQLNIYVYLLRLCGYEVNGIRVVAFFRDWSANGLLKNPKEYPARQTMEIDIPVVDQVTIFRYIKKRIRIHQDSENGSIVDCTGEERWSKGDQYAVKTKSAKRALHVSDTEASCVSFVQQNKHKYADALIIEFRPGESRKCADYCPVRDFCPQRKSELDFRQQYLKNN